MRGALQEESLKGYPTVSNLASRHKATGQATVFDVLGTRTSCKMSQRERNLHGVRRGERLRTVARLAVAGANLSMNCHQGVSYD